MVFVYSLSFFEIPDTAFVVSVLMVIVCVPAASVPCELRGGRRRRPR
jgi:hypothetical protein